MRANTIGACLRIMYLELLLLLLLFGLSICYFVYRLIVYMAASANVLLFQTSRSKPKDFTLQSQKTEQILSGEAGVCH